MANLILERTTDGDGTIVDIDGAHTVALYGTWDSATVTINISLDGGTTWIAYAAASTANAHVAVTIYGAKLKLTVASAGAGTTLKGYLG